MVENFTFRDVYFDPKEGQTVGIYLNGYGRTSAIKGVHFDNVWIGNEKFVATSPQLHTNAPVSGITFE